jgi:hypothetical protein
VAHSLPRSASCLKSWLPSGYDFAAQAQPSADRKKLEDRPEAKIDKVGVLKPGTSRAPKDKAAPAARETRERLKKASWPKPGRPPPMSRRPAGPLSPSAGSV